MDLTKQLAKFSKKEAVGEVFKEGVSTGVTMKYVPDKILELHGLQPDLPPYVRLDENFVEASEDGQKWETLAEGEELQAFRLFDPRMFGPYLKNVKEIPEQATFKAEYWIGHLQLIPESIRLGCKEFSEYREVEFLFEGDRLARMTQQDFPPATAMISIIFRAPSG